MNKISSVLDQAFLNFAKTRRNFGRPSPDNFVDEWNRKLESTGIVLAGEQSKETFSNPAGGWLIIKPEVALKILALGMP